MAESTQTPSVMQVSLPEAGETVEYRLSPDVPVKFTFFVSEVLFSCDGDDLILSGSEGGSVIIKDYQVMAKEGTLPTFELNGGEEVPGDIYLFAFSDTAMDIETAAGPEGEGDGEFLDEVAPGGVLEIIELPVVEDSSSFLDTLHFDEVIQVAPMIGSVSAPLNPLPVSLADTFDPVDETIQQVIDSPDFC